MYQIASFALELRNALTEHACQVADIMRGLCISILHTEYCNTDTPVHVKYRGSLHSDTYCGRGCSHVQDVQVVIGSSFESAATMWATARRCRGANHNIGFR